MRTLFIVISLALGAIGSYFGTPYIQGNTQAANVLVTVFSVFAGFLVAVIAVLGDPILIPAGSWRKAEQNREGIDARLLRHMWLFFLYLLVLALLFVGSLISGADPLKFPHAKQIGAVIEYFYVGLGISAFTLTLALPVMMMQLQRQRVDAEIERRRHESGIANGS